MNYFNKRFAIEWLIIDGINHHALTQAERVQIVRSFNIHWHTIDWILANEIRWHQQGIARR